uniref:Putative MFS-type transporter n=1 Tax=Talaromyces marneffei PM1 TaxID=1077442 RepID=A0A093URX7_TALMA
MPFMGSLSDILGRREILTAALLFFTVGSTVAGVAQSMDILLLGRVLQGVGGAGILPMTQIVLCDIVPLRFRPFCGISMVIVPFIIRLRTKQSSILAKLARIDWIGGSLFIGSMTSFLMAVTWGGVDHAWDSAATLAPLLIGIVGTVVSILWEKWGAREPFIRLAIFSNRSALAGYYCAMTQGLVVRILSFTKFGSFHSAVLRFVIFHLGQSILAGPYRCLCYPCEQRPRSNRNHRIVAISRTGRIRWALWSGWIFEVLASGLLILMDGSITTWRWVLILMTVGLGHGLLLQALTFVPQTMAKDTDESYAATMYNFSRTFGMAFGVAIGGTMFQNRLKQHLISAGLDATIASNADQYVAVLNTMTDQSLRDGILAAYAASFKNVFELSLALTVLGALVSLLIRKSVFDRKHVTEHVLEEKHTSSSKGSSSGDESV